jgi:signal transduction histidine kinase
MAASGAEGSAAERLAQRREYLGSFGFVAALTASETVASAAQQAVERVAETFDAEMAAIVQSDRLIASIGYPAGAAPAADLWATATGDATAILVPGCGQCSASSVRLEHPPGATLVVARSGTGGLSRSEISFLNSLARVLSLRMSMLRLVEEERALREESERQAAEVAHLLEILAERQTKLEWLAGEQAALRRVATLVATGVPQDRLFAAVAEEVSKLANADSVWMVRFESEDAVVVEALWERNPSGVEISTRFKIDGWYPATTVQRWARSTRIDDPTLLGGEIAAVWARLHVRSAVASPIAVAGRVWGAVVVATADTDPMVADTEDRVARFTELIATAVSNAEASVALTASRARLVAAGDEVRRRIERNLHDGAQQRLVTLALKLRNVRDTVPGESADFRGQLLSIESGMNDLLDELREISRGVHPAVLSQAGLTPALRSVARTAAVPVRLEVEDVKRLPEAVEVAGYYVVSEALANASKHAQATVVDVAARVADDTLRIRVCDDGVGGADPALGSGLIGLQDRVEALGGSLLVASAKGVGTTIEVDLPIAESSALPPALGG